MVRPRPGNRSQLPRRRRRNPDPDYENHVKLSFKYVRSPVKYAQTGLSKRGRPNLSFVQMTYFDFDSGANGANGIGKECVRIDGVAR